MRDTVLAVGNQKGGVGKTTTAVHLGAALAECGRRTLVWDLDTSHGATSHLGFPAHLPGSFEVLSGEAEAADVLAPCSAHPNLHLIPSARVLERLDVALAARGDRYLQPWHCLQGPMARLRALELFDVIVLDTGPNANTPTRAAYLAADWWLAVLRTERPSVEGLKSVLEDCAQVQRPDLNPRLRFLGALLVQVDGRNELGRGYRQSVQTFLEHADQPAALFRTEIPVAIAFSKAWQLGRTLFAYDPDHRALGPVRALAREVLERTAVLDEHERSQQRRYGGG